jgi:hypothetical protein
MLTNRTNKRKKTKKMQHKRKKTCKKVYGGNDSDVIIIRPRRVDVIIGMVQAISYHPEVYDDSTPAARDGMRIHQLKILRGLPILSFDNNYAMGVTDMHIKTDVNVGRRMKVSMTDHLGPQFVLHIRDIYIDYHRFPAGYFIQLVESFFSIKGGLVDCLYPYQEIGGTIYIANVNYEVLPLINVNFITSLYDVSFIDATENPLSQATMNIPGLQNLNRTELNKLLIPQFILLTKKRI